LGCTAPKHITTGRVCGAVLLSKAAESRSGTSSARAKSTKRLVLCLGLVLVLSLVVLVAEEATAAVVRGTGAEPAKGRARAGIALAEHATALCAGSVRVVIEQAVAGRLVLRAEEATGGIRLLLLVVLTEWRRGLALATKEPARSTGRRTETSLCCTRRRLTKPAKTRARPKCAGLTIAVTVSTARIVVRQPELLEREVLIWLLEGDTLVVAVGIGRCVLLLMRGEWRHSSALILRLLLLLLLTEAASARAKATGTGAKSTTRRAATEQTATRRRRRAERRLVLICSEQASTACCCCARSCCGRGTAKCTSALGCVTAKPTESSAPAI